MIFRDQWMSASSTKNSVLCAGLDPAIFEMGRGEKGLPKWADKRKWSLAYVDAVAPYAAALKPNLQYWRGEGDAEILMEVVKRAHSQDMVTILDAKLADIGSTNDAGFFYTKQLGFDAVTLAPYAGNMQQAGEQAVNYGVGAITMCLMSNPEYEVEKNKLVPITEKDATFHPRDIIQIDGRPHMKQYIYLTHAVAQFGLEGMVIGAPSENNHLEEDELRTVSNYSTPGTLVLMPGVGEQGGEAEMIWRFFLPNDVIVNVGRALMFPKGASIEDTAKHYQTLLNKLRKVA